jgi:hypothetical protein|tara:strand:- start:418 stop:555 length:138 start_codon:yes stop_codon:yes gene_type:complete
MIDDIDDIIKDLVDTTLDTDSEFCICGLPLDNENKDCYSHMSKGY